MTETTVNKLREHVGEEVVVKGWLYNKRSKGKIHFLLIRDGTGIVQGVMVKGGLPDETFQLGGRVTQESSLVVTGTVRKDDRAPGGYELELRGLEIIQMAKDYPIALQSHGPDFLLDHRHLWLRSRNQHAIMRVRHAAVKAIRDFFDERDFVLIDTPIFTPAACEGTSTLFEVKYFDDKAYLAQSGQLYGEAAAMAHRKIYCFGPTFRAEKSKTRRHLTEFWMVEPEVAFLDLDGVMDLAEEFVEYIVQFVLKTRRVELETLGRDISKLEAVGRPFPRITYTEAVEKINAAGVEMEWGNDFGAPQETALGRRYDRPVMVHRWPARTKAFYMKRDSQDERLALGVDMIAPEGYGELIGGAQREDDLETLEKRIAEYNLPREAFEWYLDLRRYGTVPHGGFGLGLERTVTWLCGIEHLRETIPFPRMLYRLYP
ncbi:MAG: asparagine--tRNA ligase [Planctomycetota bacterium]|nr:MAG: asparagine--tRNA ligase [Planctomycetota bacterium]